MAGEKSIIDFAPTEIFPGIVVNMQTMYMSWITMSIVAIILIIATKNPKIIPGKMQIMVEAFFNLIGGLTSESLGEAGKRVTGPFFLTLFMYIFIGNEIGLLPQIFEPMHFHITSPTNDINTTLGLGLAVALTINIIGLTRNGIGFFAHFTQPSILMMPLHLLDEVLRPCTLAFRLFGNIVAGEILLIVLYKLSPWIIPELWVCFSLLVGAIQAMIFTALSVSYMRGAFESHH